MAGAVGSLTLATLEDGRVLGVAFVAILAVTILLSKINQQFSSEYQFWKSQPWTGLRPELFPGTRAYFRSLFTVRDMLDKGYHNVRIRTLRISIYDPRTNTNDDKSTRKAKSLLLYLCLAESHG
jgi:hypothetical protein